MGMPTMVAFIASILAFILLLVALIVNQLSSYDKNSVEAHYGATEYVVDFDGSESTFEYADSCDDDDSSDACDFQGRGIVWIICGAVGLLFGLLSVIGWAAAQLGNLKLMALMTQMPCSQGAFLKITSLVAGVLALVGVLVWSIGNPIYDDSDYGDDWEGGASMWLAGFAFGGFVVAFGLTFAGAGESAVPAS